MILRVEDRAAGTIQATAGADAVGKEHPGGVASGGTGIELRAPLNPEALGEVAACLNNSGLDEDLRRLLIELTNELTNLSEDALGLLDDELVSTLVNLKRSPLGDEASDLTLELIRGGVVQRQDEELEVFQLITCTLGLQGHLLLSLDGLERSDADDVAESLAGKPLGLKDGGERLIPGHVLHANRDCAVDIITCNDVEAGNAGDQTEDRVDVGVDKVEADLPAGVRNRGCR